MDSLRVFQAAVQEKTGGAFGSDIYYAAEKVDNAFSEALSALEEFLVIYKKNRTGYPAHLRFLLKDQKNLVEIVKKLKTDMSQAD